MLSNKVFLLSLAVFLLAVGNVRAGNESVKICHKTNIDNQKWSAIEVPVNALTVHESHGDLAYNGGDLDKDTANAWCVNEYWSQSIGEDNPLSGFIFSSVDTYCMESVRGLVQVGVTNNSTADRAEAYWTESESVLPIPGVGGRQLWPNEVSYIYLPLGETVAVWVYEVVQSGEMYVPPEYNLLGFRYVAVPRSVPSCQY